MGRPKKTVIEKTSDKVEEILGDEKQKKEAQKDAEVAAALDNLKKTTHKDGYRVLDRNFVFVRKYCVEDHGEKAEALALEFCKKIGGYIN